MTNKATICTFLWVACASAVPGARAAECPPFEMGVHLRVDRSIASRVITADLKNETASLWRPYGVYIEWPDQAAAKGTGAGGMAGIAIEAILARRIEDPPNGPTVLGRAFVELVGPATQPIRVSFDATARMLGPRATGSASIIQLHDRDLARALGRVLAHEIGHVLLGVPRHDEAGLMRAVFRGDELAEPDPASFRLTCNDVARLRSRIRVLTGIEPEPIDRKMCIPSHPMP